ncbi:peptide transporter [Mycolicibacterium sp. P1-18]|uniref:ParB/RepB/Spo0J family partition protein n=1 Tax=Mycolicibacterium sp. P1-18 TaxID=2024615 RepID=UPI0011F17E67|nr:ParB N-terminal domain-containing protein [Mycolicibacterium sp. P1-18]KAA0093593.1 peptide transporter [Mycolicibacterium sp. P1-18]
MATGRKTDLASLAASVGDNSPVERGVPTATRPAALSTPLDDLMANPRNPRDDVGTLEDLQSIADMQLQPAVAVTKAAYLKLYPKDSVTAKYVVVNGCRRLAAAHKYGRSDLLVHVNDEIARDRITLISASIAENVDRQDFDVIEEAKAVDALVAECGRADEAAKRLKKTPGWVSQRRALLALAPELQTALRRGELAIREARSLAQVPLEQQVVRWRASMDKKDHPGEGSGTDQPRPPSHSRVIGKALGQFDAKPELLADALRTCLGDAGVSRLVDLLVT